MARIDDHIAVFRPIPIRNLLPITLASMVMWALLIELFRSIV